MYGKIIILISFFLLVAAKAPNIITCKVKDPNLAQCAQTIMQTILSVALTGVPEWKLPKGDPFEVPSLQIKGNGGSVNVDQKYSNISVLGMSKIELKKTMVRGASGPILHLDVNAFGEKISVKSNYEMKGKVLLLPLVGRGKSLYTLTNVNITVVMQIGDYKRKNRRHMKILSLNSTIIPQLVEMRLENLFDGNEKLGNQMNTVLNENWPVIYEELKPTIETIVSGLLTQYLDRFFAALKYEEILSD